MLSTAQAQQPPQQQAPQQQVSELQVFVEPLSDQDEGISVLSLNRPAAKNALGRQLLRELAESLDLLRQERTTRCLIFRSLVPGAFCVGADLKERAAMTQHEAAEFVSLLRRTFTEIEALPMPTIAVIEGYALGGGAELALACDLRVADGEAAVMAFPEARLGIIPGAGGTQRLPRLVGPSKAKELIFTAQRISAPAASAMGLVDHLTEAGGAFPRALALARDIAQAAPLSLRLAKSAIVQGLDVDMHIGLKMEESFYAQLIPSKDRLEGLRAFAEKRTPRFTGE